MEVGKQTRILSSLKFLIARTVLYCVLDGSKRTDFGSATRNVDGDSVKVNEIFPPS